MTQSPPNAPRVIAVETAGPVGSVAIALGGQLLAERTFAATAGHGRDLLPLADELCREVGWRPADLNDCHLSIGPGSFTGLRVAVAFTRHLALACGTRTVAVPTLESIAWNWLHANPGNPGPVAAWLEAKKGMVFAARFEVVNGALRALDEPSMVVPSEYLAQSPRPVIVTGSGVAQHLQVIHDLGLEAAPERLWASSARGILALGTLRAQSGHLTEPTALAPMYVRRPEAEELWEKRQASESKPG